MFWNHKGLTRIKPDWFDLENSDLYYGSYMFYNANIKYIEFDMRKNISIAHMFRSCQAESITLYNFPATSYDRTFEGCGKLKHLWIEGVIESTARAFDLGACVLLDKESICQTIKVLSDTRSGLTINFSRTAVINAFELEVDAETGEFLPSEGLDEWNALVATKHNWTISLV
jgi:hypothetical protein